MCHVWRKPCQIWSLSEWFLGNLQWTRVHEIVVKTYDRSFEVVQFQIKPRPSLLFSHILFKELSSHLLLTNNPSQWYFDAIMHDCLALIPGLNNDDSSYIITFFIAVSFMIHYNLALRTTSPSHDIYCLQQHGATTGLSGVCLIIMIFKFFFRCRWMFFIILFRLLGSLLELFLHLSR